MGVFYQAYAEAKVDGVWKGIDFYVFANGKYVPVEIVSGKSYVGEALADKHVQYSIHAKDLSPELQRDHKWSVEEDRELMWRESFVLCVEGADILAMNLDTPEHCGFVDKTLIHAYENEETEDIWDWLSAKEYAELPADVRIGYQWYAWNERGGTKEVWRRIKNGLQDRINAYNDSRYDYDIKDIPPEISMSDTRLIIFMS